MWKNHIIRLYVIVLKVLILNGSHRLHGCAARALEEVSKTLNEEEKETIWNNYIKEVSKVLDKYNAVVLFDDSDINKEYSKKLEDLDRVIDGSSKDKKIVNGYYVCEATALTKNEKQPLSIYSQNIFL